MRSNVLVIAGFLLTGAASPGLGQDEDPVSLVARLDALEIQVGILNTVIPKGAVMAFNLEDCPTGWVPFARAAGRTLIGAGKGEGLSERKLGQSDGQETVQLSPNQMPSHTHDQRVGQHALPGSKITAWNLRATGGPQIISSTQPTGRNQRHENMQPFVVVTYCEREQ